jgi:hypothetical protein
VQTALFEEDVGFVEKQDSVPARAHVEDFLELLFDVPRAETQVAGGDHEERDAHFFGDGFGSEGFAYAGRACEWM